LKFFERILKRKLALFTLVLFGSLLMPVLVSAIDPTVVTLLYFRGKGINNGIRLEWATGTELDTVGFRIERSNSSAGPYALLADIGFVPSEAPPDGLTGAQYDALDNSGTINGVTYWYRLIELESSGTENRTAPISVTAGLAVPTSTSTSTPTRTPTTIPGSSPTPIPSGQPGDAATSYVTSTVSLNTGRGEPPKSEPITTAIGQTDVPSLASNGSLAGAASFDNPGLQSTAAGYPGPETLFTPIPDPRIGAEGYPGLSQESVIGLPDAYPSSIEYARPERIQNPRNGASLANDSVSIGQGISPESELISEQSDQDPTVTLMLWVGFLAALVIFIAAVIGSAYIYRRQSPK
jgi:hypothetical protein